MAIEQGSLALLRVSANTVVGGRALNLSLRRNLIETTSKASKWKSRLPGRKSWTVSAEFLNDLDDVTGQHAIREAVIAGSTLSISIGKASPVTGDRTFSGTVRVTSLSESAPDNDAATFSADFQGDGALTITTT